MKPDRSSLRAISRRLLLTAIAAPSASLWPTNGVPADRSLLRIGRAFDVLAAQLDESNESASDIPDQVLNDLDRIEAQIIRTPALTIDGLRVKARVACWGLLGDLDAADQSTTDKRMMVSILRDLIRLHDPKLERRGAIAELVEEATS